MKKMFLAVSISVLGLGYMLTAQAFSDVGINQPDFLPILYFSETQVLQGYEDGTFRPEAPVSRAAAVKMLMTATGREMPTDLQLPAFTDVPGDSWFAPYVAWAAQTGLIDTPAGEGTFRPGDSISRAEISKLLLKAFNVNLAEHEITLDPLADVPADAWFAPFVNLLAQLQVMQVEEGTNNILPAQTVTRQELARFLFRLLAVGNGLNAEVLLQLSDRLMVQTVPTLQSGNLSDASFYTLRAESLNLLALSQLPDNATLKAVDTMIKGLKQLITATALLGQGQAEPALTNSQQAWQLAGQAAEQEEKLAQFRDQVQALAHTLAKQARAVLAQPAPEQ